MNGGPQLRRQRLGELTWTNVGLVRSGDGLTAAQTELDDLYDRSLAIAVNPARYTGINARGAQW